ncbi:hypothetical protein S7711_02914 [Stachybotrys chartarum IBT 7711]|uniref:Amino acid transporter transmembrane domain-containing protein n=1 Tax=Stachybotrys chartarum (strain CBS 109288 / IBT 7711) TaxID=1280523 RepID=A0A084B2A0_STACB|nr:hypothetical protein S7711_02914 [Stachybotrys chartarum IBT 7711]
MGKQVRDISSSPRTSKPVSGTIAAEPQSKSRAAIFGSQRALSIAPFIGPRIGPRIVPIGSDLASDYSSSAIILGQVEAESGKSIQYRTCSWRKTACLLFSEYICLAIMSFPWSYSVLGLVPGIILTVVVAALVLYTSLVLWDFCLRHPEGKEWAWWATAAMFVLNNTFIQGLHVLVGAQYINTITEGTSFNFCQTVVFSVDVTIICWIVSLPRTFSMISTLGFFSAFATFVSVLLATIFATIPERNNVATLSIGEPRVNAFPRYDPLRRINSHFVKGLMAFLNISYTFIGQITLPSFIAEMRDPGDFPKSLLACTIAEVVVFSIVGGVISLQPLFKKIAYTFMVPTIIFLGSLYWVCWRSCARFSTVGFGFMFWGVAYFRMRKVDLADTEVDRRRGPLHDFLSVSLNIFIILVGAFFLTFGTYASVESIVDEFKANSIGGVFSCKSNGI